MLDECKGDRFEELLVAFQSAVLQKILKDQGNDGSVVSQLVVARALPKTSQGSLLPLAIAHRASLTGLLRQKDQLRQRLSRFERMLDEKEADLLKAVDRLAQVDGERDLRDDHPNYIMDTRKQFETHWRGDPRWIDTLIGGGSDCSRDPLFETTFKEIWPHVRDGTVDHIIPEEDQDPLRDLENRVRSQRERLAHWQEFEASMIQPGPKAKIGVDVNSRISRPKRLDLNLKKHMKPEGNIDLTMTSQAEESETVTISAGSTNEYTKLINSFRSELDRVDQRKQQRPHAMLLGGAERHASKYDNTLAENALKMYQSHTRSRSLLERQQPFDDPKKDEVPSRILANISRRRSVPKTENGTTREPQDLDFQQREISKRPNHDKKNEYSNTATLNKATSTDSIISEAKGPASETDEENVLAQMIISSTRNAESSPIKPKPSLAERTRQSIAFTRPELANLESFTLPDMPVPEPEKRKTVAELGRRTSLIDRTRQSMSSLPASSQELHKNTHKRRQSKQFPANQFETPQKPALPALGELKEMTPPESLFREDVDCASVFKSRPKIATSPNVSPTLAGTLTMQQELLFQEDKTTRTKKGRTER